MKKSVAVALTLILLAVSFIFPATVQAFSGLAPETPEEASELFNVPVTRLERDPIGGCGWHIQPGSTLDGVVVPRYFRIDLQDGTSVDGPATVDGVNEATIWLVHAPYPEPQFWISFQPENPNNHNTVTFQLEGDPIPEFITEIQWIFGDGLEDTRSLNEGYVVSHYYLFGGEYQVTAHLRNEFGENVYTTELTLQVVSAGGVCPRNEEEAFRAFGGDGYEASWMPTPPEMVPEEYCRWTHSGVGGNSYDINVPDGNTFWHHESYPGPTTYSYAPRYNKPAEMWLGAEVPEPQIDLNGPTEVSIDQLAEYEFASEWGEQLIVRFLGDFSHLEILAETCILQDEEPNMWDQGIYFICPIDSPHVMQVSSSSSSAFAVEVMVQLGGQYGGYSGPRIISKKSLEVIVEEEVVKISNIYLPLVLNNYATTRFVPFLDEPLEGFCPENPEDYFGGSANPGGFAGNPGDWIALDVSQEGCGFIKANPSEKYWVTVQLGAVMVISETETIAGPAQIMVDYQVTLYVLEWWP